MDLQAFLSQKGVTASGLAARIGVSHSTVLRWAAKTLKPDVDRIPAIVEATEGQVTAAELRPDLASLFGADAPGIVPSGGGAP